jgi:hypothetical protein
VITVRTGRGLLIGVLIGILALVASCGDTEETTLPKAPSSAQTQSEKPLEHKLADLNAGWAQNDLKESYGKNVKLLELMEAANDSIPTGVKMKYQEILAALIILLAS